MKNGTFTVIPQNMREYQMSIREADHENDLFREAYDAVRREDGITDPREQILASDYFKEGWESAVRCLNDDAERAAPVASLIPAPEPMQELSALLNALRTAWHISGVVHQRADIADAIIRAEKFLAAPTPTVTAQPGRSPFVLGVKPSDWDAQIAAVVEQPQAIGAIEHAAKLVTESLRASAPVEQASKSTLSQQVARARAEVATWPDSVSESVGIPPAAEPASHRDAPNGIAATHRHDAGAYARCSYCGRYSLSPSALAEDRYQPMCDCGKQHGWCGSFKRPDANAKWSGAAPAAQTSSASEDADTQSPVAAIPPQQSPDPIYLIRPKAGGPTWTECISKQSHDAAMRLGVYESRVVVEVGGQEKSS